jgi:hypothetical protein
VAPNGGLGSPLISLGLSAPLGHAEIRSPSNQGKALSRLSQNGSRTTNFDEAVAGYHPEASTAFSDGEATQASLTAA